MRATKRRPGAARLQALQAEASIGAGTQTPIKPLSSYFSAPTSPKVVRAKASTPTPSA